MGHLAVQVRVWDPDGEGPAVQHLLLRCGHLAVAGAAGSKVLGGGHTRLAGKGTVGAAHQWGGGCGSNVPCGLKARSMLVVWTHMGKCEDMCAPSWVWSEAHWEASTLMLQVGQGHPVQEEVQQKAKAPSPLMVDDAPAQGCVFA